MKLIVGLGNIGKQYEKTRHNIGFMIVDAFCSKHHLTFSNSKLKADLVKTKLFNEDIIIAKPNTFMNLSGEAVQLIKKFYNIKNEDILIIYDDLDLDVGKIRLRKSGSSGGQNGIKNIINILNTQEIKRVRVGISKNKFIPTADYVLGKFSEDQKPKIEEAIKTSVSLIEDYITHDFEYIMNGYNKKWF